MPIKLTLMIISLDSCCIRRAVVCPSASTLGTYLTPSWRYQFPSFKEENGAVMSSLTIASRILTCCPSLTDRMTKLNSLGWMRTFHAMLIQRSHNIQWQKGGCTWGIHMSSFARVKSRAISNAKPFTTHHSSSNFRLERPLPRELKALV